MECGKFPKVRGLVKKSDKKRTRWILSERDSTGKIRNVTVPILDTDTIEIFFDKISEARNKIRNRRDQSLDQYVDRYIADRMLSAGSARNLRLYLRGFGLDGDTNRRAMDDIVSGCNAISTKFIKITQIRCFFRWLKERVPGVANPADGVRIKAKFSHRTRIATDEEIGILREKIKRRGDLRYYLFFLLLIGTGTRVSTVFALTPKSMDKHGYLHLYNVKAKKPYSYPIPVKDGELMDVWRQVCKDGELWAIDPRHYYYRLRSVMIRTFGRDADGETLSPHSLRHTFATKALRSGVPAEIVSKLLDHSSVSVTLNVYARFSQSQIDQAVEKIVY